MAIQRAVKFHPSLPPIEAYTIIDELAYSRLSGTVKIQMVHFATREDREALREAVADLARIAPLCSEPTPTGDEAADTEAQKACESAKIDLKYAHKRASAIKPLDGGSVVPVPLAETAQVVGDDGKPDVAKCYAWLMAWLEKQDGYVSAAAV